MKRTHKLPRELISSKRRQREPNERPPSPPSSLVEVEVAARSHQGSGKTNNEDHYLTARMERSLQVLLTNLAAGFLPDNYSETAYGFLVADGMGGMAAGEVASATAVRTLLELVANTPDWMMRLDEREEAAIVMRRLSERFRQIDEELRKQGDSDPSLFGMGTTLTLTCSLGSDLFVGHIGDSRAYMLRDDKLHQLTRDHTVGQALIDAGIAGHEDSVTRAMRNVLMAALGSTGGQTQADVQRLQVKDKDQVLLCTDGLTEVVDDETISLIMRTEGSADQVCQSLIEAALSGGGIDNATVVLARYRFPETEGPGLSIFP